MVASKSHTDDWGPGLFSDKPQRSQLQIFSSVLRTSLLFLLLGLRASGEDSAGTVVSGILGGSVTLPLNISVATDIEHVTWNGPKNALALANPKGVILMDKSYQGRLNITKWNYSLHISNLTLNDAGFYKAQINKKNSEVTTKEEFTLRVYEQLQEPQVTLKSVKVSENFSCNITLMCSVKGAEKSVLYSWTPRDSHASESNGSSILTISRMPCDPDLPYTCTAKNPVSQSSSRPVHAGQFCTDPGASKGETMGETVVGVLGEAVTLPLALPVTCRDTEKVVWMFNTSIISKEREEAATADPLIKSRDHSKNRVWVSNQDCSLKIDRLMIEDAGPYHAYVCSEASRVTSMTHVTLRIYRRLRKPKITWSIRHTEDGICRVSLTCSVEDGGNTVVYTWTPPQKEAVVSQGKSHLDVSWRSGENHPNLTCIASNPVSNTSHQFPSENICPGPKKNMKLWIGLPLMVCLLCLGIFSWWCIWKQKRRFPAFCSSQPKDPDDTPEYEKLDPPPGPARQHPMPTSDSSSDNNTTATEEDDDRPEMHMPINGRDRVYDEVPQEGAGHDSAPEAEADSDLVIPCATEVESVAGENTVYAQVSFNLQGKTPASQKEESSATIYLSIQKPQTVVPPPQQDDLEIPESPTYENFT
ncbi:T-lymphocyte surface antigen Ly-9 isoform X2 [Cebus imitator]|uniref:T-lymphocyte surface antigen Ly-9 isoform X2 n=1 Tax=Cebus imitator TaxID=2715852 RepID=UPI00080A2050|nr:T-lymphocyte surface antigen Ly-9 isoform X2 [Cebus imitator]